MKSVLTILLICLSTIIKAQDTIKIPVPAARQVAKDLTICDSTKAVLELTKQTLVKTEVKTAYQDSIIKRYDIRCAMYDTMLVNEKSKYELQGSWLKTVKKENRVLKIKLLYTKITLSSIAAFLGYLYLTK